MTELNMGTAAAEADGVESHPVTVLGRLSTGVLLSVSGAGSVVWTFYWDKPYPLPLLVIVVASFVPLVLVVAVEPLRRRLTLGVVAPLIVAVLSLTAVFARPGIGADVDVYAMYGRIIVEHGDSPYVHAPSEYPDDPWTRNLQLFSGTRNFYGPLFTGLTAGIAKAAGETRWLVHLGYKAGAAAAVALALVILVRIGAPLAGVVLLGLNPVTVVEVVGQGRMDAYVGVALLGGAVLAARRRPHLAALAIAAGALVKIPAGLALVALVAWVWRRDDVRRAGTVALTGAGTVGLAYLAAGGMDAVRPLLKASSAFNAISIWRLVSEFPDLPGVLTGEPSSALSPPGMIPTVASIAAITLAAFIVAPRVDEHMPVLVLALPLVAYLLTSPYPSSWYLLWVLPLLALRPRSWPTVICASFCGALMVLQFYATAARVREGAQSLADFTVPVSDPLLRVLHSAVFLIEVLGIMVLCLGVIRSRGAHRFTRRSEAAS